MGESKEDFTREQKHVLATSILIIFTAGAIGNVTICILYKKTRDLQTLSNILIANLAVCDVFQCLNTGFMIYNLLSRNKEPGFMLCQISGYIKVTLTFVSFSSVTLITIKRYCMIVETNKPHMFGKKKILYAVAIVWLYHACLGVAPMTGWSFYSYEPGKLTCTCEIKSSISFSILIAVTSMLTPLLVIVFCSVKIVKKMKESRTSIEQNGTTILPTRRRVELRATMILFSVIISYLACNLPFIVVNVMSLADEGYVIPLKINAATTIITQLNPVFNPIIFGLWNENFRRVLHNCCYRNDWRVHSVPTNMEMK